MAIKTIEVGVETFSLILRQNIENKLTWVLLEPEQKGQYGERANIHPTACNRTEYSSQEPNEEQDHSLPHTKVHNRVKCFSFMFPQIWLICEKKNLRKLLKPIQQKKRERKTKPDADKAQFLLRWRQYPINNFKSWNLPRKNYVQWTLSKICK